MYNSDGSATVPGLIKHKALLSINTPLRKPKQHHCSQASVTYISADTRTQDTKRRIRMERGASGRGAFDGGGGGNTRSGTSNTEMFNNCIQ